MRPAANPSSRHPRRPVAAAAAGVMVALLSGCAATASQSWRTAPGSDAWQITGEQGMWGNTVIRINDTPVMEGKISYWTGEGEMAGTYEGLPVSAKCRKARSSQVRTACAVIVDGRKATTLYFRVK